MCFDCLSEGGYCWNSLGEESLLVWTYGEWFICVSTSFGSTILFGYKPNLHCVEVDPLKVDPLDILKQEYLFIFTIGSIKFYFHTIPKPTKDSLKMTSFVTTTFQIWGLYTRYGLDTSL
jgi:hypothetical protein